MTLTHRLTNARDGPKVMTVTDSNLPYKFEAGMHVRVNGSTYPHVFILFDDGGEVQVVNLAGARGWFDANEIVADIDHPGTRGLLLAQYREASGRGIATAVCREGWWCVVADAGSMDSDALGDGESEGAAILDALTRLAASKAEAAAETAVDGDCHRRVDALADRINVLDAKLARMDATLANLADRMANLDGMGAP